MNVALVAIMAAITLLPSVAHAQDSGGNVTAGAGQEAGEATNMWVIAGIIMAAAAVAGTIWNGCQLRKHVDLVKKDMDERLRPQLGWTTDSNLLLRHGDVDSGGVFRIRIINAGQVAARNIVCHMNLGLASDFEAGRIKHEREFRGSLAPNMVIEVRVPITTEQMKAASPKDQFHAEIMIEYRGPGKKPYKYSMSGDYDGVCARWSD